VRPDSRDYAIRVIRRHKALYDTWLLAANRSEFGTRRRTAGTKAWLRQQVADMEHVLVVLKEG
jgi:hypothetical protein